MDVDAAMRRIAELEEHVARQNELIKRQMLQLAESQIKEKRRADRETAGKRSA